VTLILNEREERKKIKEDLDKFILLFVKQKKKYLFFYLKYLKIRRMHFKKLKQLISLNLKYKKKIIKFKKFRKFKKKSIRFFKLKRFKFFFRKFKKFIKFFEFKYYKIFNKKLHFSFKNFFINDKYINLHNTCLIEDTRFDLFCLTYFKHHYLVDSFYNYYFEEDFFNGSTPTNMLKKDYDYLANTLYNLYFFYK
jgi:hypothetical protein